MKDMKFIFKTLSISLSFKFKILLDYFCRYKNYIVGIKFVSNLSTCSKFPRSRFFELISKIYL